LIGTVFADELDASGHSALQEMRVVSTLSPVLGGLLSSALFSDFVLGYVWLADGRVVGNVTFQRTEMAGIRWRISNVAVAPAYRGQGVARQLMAATLREIAQRGGSWSILQVRVDNPAAHHLYSTLGFTDVCQDGLWQRADEPVCLADLAVHVPAEGFTLRPLPASRWQDRLELARAARTPLAHWADPLEPASFQPGVGRLLGEALGSLTGLQRVRRWGIWEQDRLQGALEVLASNITSPHRLRFEIRPESRPQLAGVLLAQGLRELACMVTRPVVVEHGGDDAHEVAALKAFGFRPQRILVTMRRLMTPADL
jgi:GNAT superfamily N-acetyltransferase